MEIVFGKGFAISDRGAPGRGISGWGMPRWARSSFRAGGALKPTPVGARYFCGDDYPQSVAQHEPCAVGDMYSMSKADYQQLVTDHYTEEHKDLHYPVDQAALDVKAIEAKHKALAEKAKLDKAYQEAMVALVKNGLAKAEGGAPLDTSSQYLAVARPRELPDFTEFDFPDANVADAGAEEIELDQLISIAARQGRRFLGAEIQNLGNEFMEEVVTLAADTVLKSALDLNTRTGGFNLDDPENLWRQAAFLAVNVTEGSSRDALEENSPPPGGQVYVAPRLFWRFTNNLDRQVDIGDLFVRIATIAQPLSTFLLFELLEQYSGLFGLT